MPTLRNLSAGIDLSHRVSRVRSPWERIVGWLGAARIAPLDGKWFEPCAAIHTIGMRSAIDVIFLDGDAAVLELRSRVSPHRPFVGHRHAKSIVEMGPGFFDDARIAVGDRLALIDSGQPPEDRHS